jgi:hypothetical protein
MPSMPSAAAHRPCCQAALLWPTQPLCRYFNLSGAHALLATVNGPGVVAAFTLANMPPERGLRACANLAGLVPPGEHNVLLLRRIPLGQLLVLASEHSQMPGLVSECKSGSLYHMLLQDERGA